MSAALGLLGTIIYGQSLNFLSLETTSLLSILWFFGCLTVSFVGLFVGDGSKSWSSYLLIAGVLLSRIGLYMFDVGVKQIFQRTVDEPVRGEVGGSQTFLNSLSTFSLSMMGLVFSRVDDFWILGSIGYASVGVSTLCYTFVV